MIKDVQLMSGLDSQPHFYWLCDLKQVPLLKEVFHLPEWVQYPNGNSTYFPRMLEESSENGCKMPSTLLGT